MSALKDLSRRFWERLLFLAWWAIGLLAVVGLGWVTYRYWVNVFRSRGTLVALVVPQLKLMGLLLAAMVVLLMAVVGAQLLASRWRAPRVFIIYQNAAADLAAELHGTLEALGLASDYIPFVERDHDQVLSEVRRRIQRAHVVVALPGETRSFLDAELLAASTLERPIIIVKHLLAQSQPDTGYRGYPVFNLDKLRKYGFRPLGHLIRYASNHWSDVMLNAARALGHLFEILMFAILVGTLLGVPKMIFDALVLFGKMGPAYHVALGVYWAIIAVFAAGLFYQFVLTVMTKIRTIGIVKQEIVTGGFTFEKLEQALGGLSSDLAVLACLEREALPLRHP